MDTNCSDYVWNNPTLFSNSYYVKAKKNQMENGGILTGFNYSIGGL